MNDQVRISSIPYGGPYLWVRNDRGNLELVRLATVKEAVGRAAEIAREHLAAVGKKASGRVAAEVLR